MAGGSNTRALYVNRQACNHPVTRQTLKRPAKRQGDERPSAAIARPFEQARSFGPALRLGPSPSGIAGILIRLQQPLK